MAASFSPPVSRQPSCRFCDHEAHVFTRCHAELARGVAVVDEGDALIPLLCPCPPSRPTGIYEETR